MEIIELVSCPRNGVNCSELRGKINQLLLAANKSRINKEYRKAIDEVREAYFSADCLTTDSCRECMDLFQETMLNSLKQTNGELKRMSSGFLRSQRYREVYLFSSETLDELTKHYLQGKEKSEKKTGT